MHVTTMSQIQQKERRKDFSEVYLQLMHLKSPTAAQNLCI